MREREPDDVHDVLYPGVRADHREDELPGQVRGEGHDRHAVRLVGDAALDDQEVGGGPAQPGDAEDAVGLGGAIDGFQFLDAVQVIIGIEKLVRWMDLDHANFQPQNLIKVSLDVR